MQTEASVTCTLGSHRLPVRPSRRFDCVCCLGPGPDNGQWHGVARRTLGLIEVELEGFACEVAGVGALEGD